MKRRAHTPRAGACVPPRVCRLVTPISCGAPPPCRLGRLSLAPLHGRCAHGRCAVSWPGERGQVSTVKARSTSGGGGCCGRGVDGWDGVSHSTSTPTGRADDVMRVHPSRGGRRTCGLTDWGRVRGRVRSASPADTPQRRELAPHERRPAGWRPRPVRLPCLCRCGHCPWGCPGAPHHHSSVPHPRVVSPMQGTHHGCPSRRCELGGGQVRLRRLSVRPAEVWGLGRGGERRAVCAGGAQRSVRRVCRRGVAAVPATVGSKHVGWQGRRAEQ